LENEADQSLLQICRSAAHARLISALEFVKSLRPEHLQSFWYSASKYNFALIGTFVGLLWATASTQDEAHGYKERLQEYQWFLRLSSKSAEILDRAASMLAMSTGVLVKAIPEKDSMDSHDDITTVSATDEADEDDGISAADWAVDSAQPDDISMQASPTQFSEGHMDMFWPSMPAGFHVTGGFDDGDENGHHFMGLDGDMNGY
jgi:hypothetical protein